MESRQLRDWWPVLALPAAMASVWALPGPAGAACGIAAAAAVLAAWALVRLGALRRRLREAEAASAREAAERREVERSLAEQQQRLKIVFESAPECIKIQAADGTIIDMNPAGLKLIDARRREDIVGKSAYGYIARECRPKYAELTERVFRGETASLEFRLVGFAGTERWLETHAVPLRDPDGRITALLGLTRDVTDRHNAEEHERQHRIAIARLLRMHSMGEMATTIAHELNQPLTAIVNYARGAVRRLQAAERGAPGPVIESLEAASREAERAARIIRNIRNFLRKQPTPQERCDLNAIVASALALMQPELRRQDIRSHVALADGLPGVDVVPIEIEQVIVNLTRNAIEAMACTSGRDRRLTIATRKAGAASAEVALGDTGPGLPPEAGDVFDPFVTTKADGLGMGLAITRSIVDAHGGRIWVERSSPQGTTLVFSLPATAER